MVNLEETYVEQPPINSYFIFVYLPIHVTALICMCWLCWHPQWKTLWAFLVANMLISGVGMSVGFHRYFTHSAFEARAWARWLMLICGSLAHQGSPLFWTALHRHHHVHADKPEDLHTPQHGFWHAYQGWITRFDPDTFSMRRAASLLRYPGMRWFHNYYNTKIGVWNFMLAMCMSAWPATEPWVVGIYLAQCWAVHQEAIVNSVCHRWGTRRFVTSDRSTNVAWLAPFTWGQTLHHNHHAVPGANFSTRWWELDTGYWLIKLLRK